MWPSHLTWSYPAPAKNRKDNMRPKPTTQSKKIKWSSTDARHLARCQPRKCKPVGTPGVADQRFVSQPVRVQLSRKSGWKLPPNTVVVSRPSHWGNPFVVGRDGSRATCVGVKATPAAQNEAHMHAAGHIGELRGKNLACWCPANSACHADVLLRLANNQAHPTAAGGTGGAQKGL